MNLYLVSIIKIALIFLGVGYLIARYTLLTYGSSAHQVTYKKWLKFGAGIVGILSIFAWTNAGHFFYKVWVTDNDPLTYVTHTHEQYHFYFGSKYLPELGYGNLYTATYVASQELGLEMSAVSGMRDPLTFNWISARMISPTEVKARFTPERWAEFVSDVQAYFSFNPRVHAKLFADHGNTGSPAWAVLPSLLTQHTSATLPTFFWLSLLDITLLIACVILLYRSFGGTVMVLCVLAFSIMPYVFDFTFGSLLRFDWFAAVVIGTCLFQKKRYVGSGLLFGYAIASKLFPILFLVGLGALAIKALITTKKMPKHYLVFFGSVAGGLALAVGISSAYFYKTPNLWPEYIVRISTAAKNDNIDYSYSFKAPFSQLASPQMTDYVGNWFVPIIPLSQQGIDFNNPPFAGSYFVTLGLLALLLIAVVLKNEDEIDAIALSSLLLFLFLSLYMYYMILFAVFTLFWARKAKSSHATWYGVIFLLPWAVYHYLSHRNSEPLALATTSFWLSLAIVLVLVLEAQRFGLWQSFRQFLLPHRAKIAKARQ